MSTGLTLGGRGDDDGGVRRRREDRRGGGQAQRGGWAPGRAERLPGPEAVADLVTELGPLVSVATAEQAARAGDIVMVRTPFGAERSIPVEPMAGKVVLDGCNYDPRRDGHIIDLDTGRVTSSGLLQHYLRGSQVVKVFNNILARHLRSLARPHGAADRSALPIAGNDN